MNPHQAAKTYCDCHADGACLGITLTDDLNLVRFRPENSKCLLADPVQRCRHFEQCILPMEKRTEWSRDARKSASLAAEFKEAAYTYRIRTGYMTSPIRLCPQCRTGKISNGRKLCDPCKAKNRRETQKTYHQSKNKESGSDSSSFSGIDGQ